jgi:hypothetical protein
MICMLQPIRICIVLFRAISYNLITGILQTIGTTFDFREIPEMKFLSAGGVHAGNDL